jgi:hypothetical protein
VRGGLLLSLIVVAQAAAQSATLAGRILADTSGRVIVGAEIAIADASLRAVTDSEGEFRLGGIPAGAHAVQFRKIGYAAVNVTLEFAAGQTMVRTIYLDRVTTLDSVTVKSTTFDPQMDAFEENRKRGFGQFVTSAEIRAKEGMLTSTLLRQRNGFDVVQAGNEDWIVSHSTPRSRCAGFTVRAAQAVAACLKTERVFFVPDDQNKPILCHPRFYLDDMLLNPGDPAEPINLREYPPTMLEAMELYTGNAEVPPKFAGKDAKCGIVVLHRKR